MRYHDILQLSLRSPISITNSIILIVHQINCIFSQYVPSISWWCTWDSMTHNNPYWQFCYQCQHIGSNTFFFKTYNHFQQSSSKHHIDLMKLLHMTVKQSNVNNNVLSHLPSHEKDIYKLFMGGKHSIQTNLPVPTKFDISNTECISLDAFIDHVLSHGIPIYLLMILQMVQTLQDCMVQSNVRGWLTAYLQMHQTLPTHM